MKNRKMSDGKKQVSVFREAWENMSADFSFLLPEKMRRSSNARKFVILSVIVDLVVLGAAGKFLYDWLAG